MGYEDSHSYSGHTFYGESESQITEIKISKALNTSGIHHIFIYWEPMKTASGGEMENIVIKIVYCR